MRGAGLVGWDEHEGAIPDADMQPVPGRVTKRGLLRVQ